MPAQTLLPAAPDLRIEPAQLPFPSQVAAVAARESYSHSLVIQSLVTHAARGERLGVLIGHNHFDVYALSRLALEHGLDPRPILERIELSRAFTCHQQHRRILPLGSPHTKRWSSHLTVFSKSEKGPILRTNLWCYSEFGSHDRSFSNLSLPG